MIKTKELFRYLWKDENKVKQWWQGQGDVTFAALRDKKQDVNTETKPTLSWYRKYSLRLAWPWIKRQICQIELLATDSENKPMALNGMNNFHHKFTSCGFMEL